MKKRNYERPTLNELGSFETVTKGGQTGNALDQAFPTGTPFSDLTFS
ncbi:MAG: lasso RiPP family leader peptide-containing protein [Erythrobacter sp.]|nr:lasso RiPP family leader peptide-containing protein [Erythrobacter sp.]